MTVYLVISLPKVPYIHRIPYIYHMYGSGQTYTSFLVQVGQRMIATIKAEAHGEALLHALQEGHGWNTLRLQH